LTVEAWNRAIGTAAVLVGETKLGAPYVYSAGGPNAFDCSNGPCTTAPIRKPP